MFGKGPNYPMYFVNWDECQEFCKKLSEKIGMKIKLPTEEQWEYACRAGTTGPYAGNLSEMGWYKGNSGGHTHGIGLKAPNVLGLYDLHGNVREWTASSEGFFRVIRGGGCRDIASRCTASKRIRFIPEIRNDDRGFRLAY